MMKINLGDTFVEKLNTFTVTSFEIQAEGSVKLWDNNKGRWLLAEELRDNYCRVSNDSTPDYNEDGVLCIKDKSVQNKDTPPVELPTVEDMESIYQGTLSGITVLEQRARVAGKTEQAALAKKAKEQLRRQHGTKSKPKKSSIVDKPKMEDKKW